MEVQNMHNSWIKFFIPKVKIHVDSLAEVAKLRAENIRIYSVNKTEDGYTIVVRRGALQESEVVGKVSIYGAIFHFVVPVVCVWASLLIALQYLTIDYQIRGNLVRTDIARVEELVQPMFTKIGPLSVFIGNNESLVLEIEAIFHDYIWVDIQTVGSRMFIDIFDTQVTDKLENNQGSDYVYASQSGQITYINAKGCRVLVEIGQVVKKDTPLIACYTPTGYSGDVLVPIEGVASGVVHAEVWYAVYVDFPQRYVSQMINGSITSQLYLNFGTNSLRIWGPSVDYEAYDERRVVFNPLSFFNISPITLERVHYYEKSDIIFENEIETIQSRADGFIKSRLGERFDTYELVDLLFVRMEEREDGMIRLVYHATVNHNIAN